MPRMHEYEDGTVGTTWMAGGSGMTPERGGGYNYYDGTEWGTPNLHVGPDDRQGWPNYAAWGPNGEVLVTYKYANPGDPLWLFFRENKGEGEWNQVVLNGPPGSALVWHSMITSGENNEHIHILAYSYDEPVGGQDNALLYYRSSDGGQTWDQDGVIIDGVGIDYYPNAYSLSYTWANPVGNTIAFTYGFLEWGGQVFKSTDNGDSWESMDVYLSDFDPFDPPVNSPRIPCGSGTSAIALDSDGDVHVVFPRMGVIYIDESWNYYPYTDGLIYWNESMEPLDSTIISSSTLEYLEESGNLIARAFPDESYTLPSDQPTYQQTLCEWPTISIDDQDNMFVAYSAVTPDYLSGTGFYYRHIFVTSSWDGGQSWIEPIDLNTDIQYLFSECVYPQATLTLTDHMNIVFQEDFEPGIAEWLNNHEVHDNNMFYISVPKSDLVGISEDDIKINFEVSELYPNPASNAVNLNINLENSSPVNISLINTIGQVVKADRLDEMTGKRRISFDVSDLKAGIYYCNITVDGATVSRKLVVY
jgi:hypothetical protein